MFWNSLYRVPITKYPKKCLGHYNNPCFWWLKMAAHKIKSDFWPKKWLLDFWPCQKKVTGPKLQKWAKYWLKTSFGWYLHFYDRWRKQEVIVLSKKSLLVLQWIICCLIWIFDHKENSYTCTSLSTVNTCVEFTEKKILIYFVTQ